MGSYLITGVSGGIGRALATRLLTAGHSVSGIVRRPGAVDGLPLASVAIADLAAPGQLAQALQELLDGLTELDGVIHCAGVVRPGPLAREQVDGLAEQFAVNVTAVVELTRLLLPALRAATGTVLLVNSGSGLHARTPLAGYGASKHALRAYADVLRAEEPSLRVSTLYPGRVATVMQRTVREAEQDRYLPDEYLSPETVANVIVMMLTLPAEAVMTDVTLRPRTR